MLHLLIVESTTANLGQQDSPLPPHAISRHGWFTYRTESGKRRDYLIELIQHAEIVPTQHRTLL
jgi:hypothetical protein